MIPLVRDGDGESHVMYMLFGDVGNPARFLGGPAGAEKNIINHLCCIRLILNTLFWHENIDCSAVGPCTNAGRGSNNPYICCVWIEIRHSYISGSSCVLIHCPCCSKAPPYSIVQYYSILITNERGFPLSYYCT